MNAANCARDSPPLRPYQLEDLEKLKSYEGRSALCVLATGLGKTREFTEFLRWEVTENDHHCLILSHREELVHQPLTYLPDIRCGMELAEQQAHHETIISASVQSLVGRLKKYNPREIDTIIVDEAHHAAAPTYRRILEYFNGATVFGFTATAHRSDGIGLGCVFDDLLIERDTLWGIRKGFLAPMECVQVNLKYDMGSVQISEYGDFNQNDVARVMSGTAAGVAEAYEKHARGPTIVFAASLNEVKDITHFINQRAGKTIAAAVTASTPHRDSILSAYRRGFYKVLVNFGIFTEGTDLPATESVLIARPISATNVGLYAQMVGRGLRLSPGKKSCKVIDCVGISNSPICTAATLIGKDLPEPKPEQAKQEKQPDENKKIEVLSGEAIPETWIKKESEVSIMDKGVGVDMHEVAWIALKNGGYILPIPNVIYRISKPLPDGTVYLRRNKACAKAALPQQYIFDWVYQDLKAKHKSQRHIWDKTQRRYWDKQPITSAQIDLIHRLAPDYKINTKAMKRGEASALIQSLLYVKEEEKNAEESS